MPVYVRKARARSSSRRQFLIAGAILGGGLIVGAHLGTRRSRIGNPLLMDPKDGEYAFNGWIKIDSTGLLTVAVPRTEMGQGVHTSLPLIVAEEMDADWTKVRVMQAVVDPIYVNLAIVMDCLGPQHTKPGYITRRLNGLFALQLTTGSSSVRDAWQTMRQAGAIARGMLLRAAAHYWDVSVEECETRQGMCLHPDSHRSLSFGQIAPYAAYFPLKEVPRLKDPSAFNLLGQSVARLDIPSKVDGSAQYGIDTQLSGMLHASIKSAPQLDSRVKNYETSAVIGIPGVRAVMNLNDCVAVIADSHFRAQTALDALPVEFSPSRNEKLSQKEIDSWLDAALENGGRSVHEDIGDTDKALKDAAVTVEARYRVPFLAHASMEPMNCTALVSQDHCDVWAATQAPDLARRVAAKVSGLTEGQVTVHTPYAGGGFGRLLEMDAVERAVTIAAKLKDKPVKLIYSRDQDMKLDYYRPAAVCSLTAGLDTQGSVMAWRQRIASTPVADAFAKRWLRFGEERFFNRSDSEGATESAYLVANRRVEHASCEQPLPVGFWRSHTHSYTAFFSECFIDELAEATHLDPLRFRLRLLAGRPRHQAVLDLAARKIHWEKARAPGTGIGLALHEAFGSVVAQGLEIEVAADGTIRIRRVVCAVDCGLAIHPDGVRAQVEGGVIFGLSAALFGNITLENGAVQQHDFLDYPVLTMAQTPPIETFIVPSAGAPGGMGGVAVPPVAPALVNAIASATKQRIRTLPLSTQGFTLA